MMRATTDPGSPYYAVFVTPGNGIDVQWRTAQGASSSQILAPGSVPAYLMVGRYTTTGSNPVTYYTAYTSPDGTNWTPVPGSSEALTMPGSLLAGIAMTSHAQGTGGSVTLDTVGLANTELPPPVVCPTSWNCADIGQVSPSAGGQTLSGTGTWNVTGGGGDIFGTSDSYHFVWRSLAADGSVTARVDSQSNSNSAAKAGLMLRASTDPGAPYYGIFVMPSGSTVVQSRSAQGVTTVEDGPTVTGSPPVYLRLTRTGTSFTAYTSPDGVNWTMVPSSTTTLAALTGSLLAGLAVTSHNTSQMSTAVFDSLTIG
jgi:hypothetical protein